MSVHIYPRGTNMHDHRVWSVKDKKAELARVVEAPEGVCKLYWLGKWSGIYANNDFDTPDEALAWVVAMLASAQVKKGTTVRGKGIRLKGSLR